MRIGILIKPKESNNNGNRILQKIYCDDKNKKFGVSYIETSDEKVTNKTCELKRKGFEVRISVVADALEKLKQQSNWILLM